MRNLSYRLRWLKLRKCPGRHAAKGYEDKARGDRLQHGDAQSRATA